MSKLTKIDAEPWTGLKHEGVARACFIVALDNGGINRDRSAAKWRRDYNRWLAKQEFPNIEQIDAWFLSLSEGGLEEACVGGTGDPEVEAIRSTAPAFMDDVLNAYFDEVC